MLLCMNRKTFVFVCALLTVLSCVLAAAAEESPPILTLTGDWQVQVTIPSQVASGGQPEITVLLDVSPPIVIAVKAEKFDRLPLFNPQAAGWTKGAPLHGVAAQECTSFGMLDPGCLVVRTGLEPDALRLEPSKDFAADLDWGTIGRLPGGALAENQPVYVDYRFAALRIDSIVLTRKGQIKLRQGEAHVATPVAPGLGDGERRLANVFVPGRLAKLEPQHLFPILEAAYPEPPKPSPSLAEQLLPKTLEKLRAGSPVRILAWGDSVTDGSYVPDPDHNRWQAQFVTRLQSQFPQAKIELVTEAWGGRSTASYLAEPAGSPHNYQALVLGAKPDLIVSEFVNDAGLTPEQVEERYAKFLADFTAIGAEWIILTPHYVRPDWMGLSAQRDIDADPRPYVTGLRQFAAKHRVALADASVRWGRLWRQGIPYNTLHMNTINHPNTAGMKLFADSLMALFP
jgi:lysophospholipase L1-like esterase